MGKIVKFIKDATAILNAEGNVGEIKLQKWKMFSDVRLEVIQGKRVVATRLSTLIGDHELSDLSPDALKDFEWGETNA